MSTRYHVGHHEIGLAPEYRVECIGEDFDEIFAWLEGDISGVAENVEDETPFDELYARLSECTTVAELVGEHVVDAFVFFVRPVTGCACPCDCAEQGEECDGVHSREAIEDDKAADGDEAVEDSEPQLGEPDDKGVSRFSVGGSEYHVFNTASTELPGFWACYPAPQDGVDPATRSNIVAGMKSRERAFEVARDKLQARRVITILPRQYHDITVSDAEREEYGYPSVERDGWVGAWHAEGYMIVFEDRIERGIVWPDRPVEARIIGHDGREHDLDGNFRNLEAAALAIREHHLTARTRRGVDVELLPVIVTELPDDEDHAPLLVDPAAARVVKAAEVADGDTVLASFGTGGGMLRSDYFNDQYTAHPMTYDPTHGCGSCATMADHDGPVVNLGDDNPWEVCDPHAADSLLLVVPAARLT
jgi:hypothetical protein